MSRSCPGIHSTTPYSVHDQPTNIRASILSVIKNERSVAIADLAERFDVTYEAIRQHMNAMESEGLILRRVIRSVDHAPDAGRPPASYSLTTAGENSFPKAYDELASALIAAIESELDGDARDRVLGAITNARVDRLRSRVRGRMIERRLDVLRDFYSDGDSFMHADATGAELTLTEYNCPFLNVALNDAAICSTSVTALSRLLGAQVFRDERFQSGDGRCVFRVMLERPVDEDGRGFSAEPE